MFIEDILEEKLTGLVLIYGPGGTGKTTACLSALKDRSIYLASSNNFSSERLKSLRLDHDQVLDKIVLFEPKDLPSWERAIEQAVKLSQAPGKTKPNIIIIDTVATQLRLAPKKVANLALHKILSDLSKAECPVLMTSEVYSKTAKNGEINFIGGDMLRLSATTIIELTGNELVKQAIVRKHRLHSGRTWNYTIETSGLARA